MCIWDLNVEFEKLEITEIVDAAQGATATLHKDWLDIESVDLSAQKGLSSLFSSSRAQKEKLKNKANEAFWKLYDQGEQGRVTIRPTSFRFARFDISPYSASAPAKPRTIPRLTLGPISGKTSVVRLGLD